MTSMIYHGCCNTSPGTTVDIVQDLMNGLEVSKAMVASGLKTSVVNCRAGTGSSTYAVERSKLAENT